jgi:hypothetical protein
MKVMFENKNYDCLVYVDPIIEEGTPDSKYASTINEGLVDSKLSQDYVEKYIRNKIPLNE